MATKSPCTYCGRSHGKETGEVVCSFSGDMYPLPHKLSDGIIANPVPDVKEYEDDISALRVAIVGYNDQISKLKKENKSRQESVNHLHEELRVRKAAADKSRRCKEELEDYKDVLKKIHTQCIPGSAMERTIEKVLRRHSV